MKQSLPGPLDRGDCFFICPLFVPIASLSGHHKRNDDQRDKNKPRDMNRCLQQHGQQE